MSGKTISLMLKAVVGILPITLLVNSAGAATEKVLYSFPLYGSAPEAGLVMDKNGNLYGTTSGGGSDGFGSVFELSPGPDGAWTKTVIHSFSEHGRDGWGTVGELVLDASGNLYGANTYGGSTVCSGGCGTVFELTPVAGEHWTETLVYNFDVEAGGNWPTTGLAIDSAGNLYGETNYGGSHDQGGIFELTPTAGAGWVETVLLNFDFAPAFANPNPLIVGAGGNLYGTTYLGGIGAGSAFELIPQGGGVWTETVLHNFGNGSDGYDPDSGLASDGSGNLYGETGAGGTVGDGTVFELTPEEGGGWTEAILHNYASEVTGGEYPRGGLTFDAKGNFYGTTQGGGPYASPSDLGGEIFEYTSTNGGGWEHKVLHYFGKGLDGQEPNGGLVVDAAGNVYGTTVLGGIYGNGAVFEIVP